MPALSPRGEIALLPRKGKKRNYLVGLLRNLRKLILCTALERGLAHNRLNPMELVFL